MIMVRVIYSRLVDKYSLVVTVLEEDIHLEVDTVLVGIILVDIGLMVGMPLEDISLEGIMVDIVRDILVVGNLELLEDRVMEHSLVEEDNLVVEHNLEPRGMLLRDKVIGNLKQATGLKSQQSLVELLLQVLGKGTVEVGILQAVEDRLLVDMPKVDLLLLLPLLLLLLVHILTPIYTCYIHLLQNLSGIFIFPQKWELKELMNHNIPNLELRY